MIEMTIKEAYKISWEGIKKLWKPFLIFTLISIVVSFALLAFRFMLGINEPVKTANIVRNYLFNGQIEVKEILYSFLSFFSSIVIVPVVVMLPVAFYSQQYIFSSLDDTQNLTTVYKRNSLSIIILYLVNTLLINLIYVFLVYLDKLYILKEINIYLLIIGKGFSLVLLVIFLILVWLTNFIYILMIQKRIGLFKAVSYAIRLYFQRFGNNTILRLSFFIIPFIVSMANKLLLGDSSIGEILNQIIAKLYFPFLILLDACLLKNMEKNDRKQTILDVYKRQVQKNS